MSNFSDNNSNLNDIFKVFSQLSEILKKNELTEIEYSNDKQSFLVKKQSSGQISSMHNAMPYNGPPYNTMPVYSAPLQSQAADPVQSVAASSIKSPMIGVAYLSPSPSDENFVKVGDPVTKGQVVMIIEAMKVMNEVKSDKDGVVAKVCVSSGDVVEFGQALIELS